MQELQVPTRRVVVEVFTDDGRHYSGGMFVTEPPYGGEAIELLLAALNDERTFLPFDAAPGMERCPIVNKEHIARVSLGHDGEADAGGGDGCCTLRLCDGTALSGHVTVDTPWSLSRLLDKLNCARRFVRLDTGSTHELVRTSHILRVD